MVDPQDLVNPQVGFRLQVVRPLASVRSYINSKSVLSMNPALLPSSVNISPTFYEQAFAIRLTLIFWHTAFRVKVGHILELCVIEELVKLLLV